jgi:hypothetical protein
MEKIFGLTVAGLWKTSLSLSPAKLGNSNPGDAALQVGCL